LRIEAIPGPKAAYTKDEWGKRRSEEHQYSIISRWKKGSPACVRGSRRGKDSPITLHAGGKEGKLNQPARILITLSTGEEGGEKSRGEDAVPRGNSTLAERWGRGRAGNTVIYGRSLSRKRRGEKWLPFHQQGKRACVGLRKAEEKGGEERFLLVKKRKEKSPSHPRSGRRGTS